MADIGAPEALPFAVLHIFLGIHPHSQREQTHNSNDDS